MKKALAILLALSMVFVAFADEPATNYSVAEFSGSAELGWKSDLDKEENGLFNNTSATLKINLLNGGDKATAGDGIWGELKIKIDTPDALENPGALEIAKAASVETAKIHIVEGDVGIALNIKAPSLSLGNATVATATGSSLSNTDNNPDDASLTNGFAIEVTTSVIDVNAKVMDNGVAADKEFGFAADASIKVVEGLDLKAAVAYADETTAMRFGAGYKLAIDDALYVKPAADFTMMGEAKDLVAGILFGWGGADLEPGLDYVADKCADGVSVAFKTDLTEKAGELVFGIYDSTLVDGLKMGADFATKLADFGKGTANVGVKYGTAIDIIDLEAHAGVTLAIADETTADYKYGAKVSTDDVIDNTVLSASYEGGKDKKGTITVSAKISL